MIIIIKYIYYIWYKSGLGPRIASSDIYNYYDLSLQYPCSRCPFRGPFRDLFDVLFASFSMSFLRPFRCPFRKDPFGSFWVVFFEGEMQTARLKYDHWVARLALTMVQHFWLRT